MDRGWEDVPDTIAHGGVLICNRVFPGDWDFEAPLITGFRVLTTYGVHPRLATSRVNWHKLEQRIRAKSCIAVGECGLDEVALTGPMEDGLKCQQEVLRKQVQLAGELQKPLVLHVRGKTVSATERLLSRVLELLKGKLPRQHRIYVHCFTGSIEELFKWRSNYPNSLFGISWHSTEGEQFAEVGRRAPIELLALESDAPHLSPVRGCANRPQWIIRQAQVIAELRNLPVEVVLKRCNSNAAKFFGFL